MIHLNEGIALNIEMTKDLTEIARMNQKDLGYSEFVSKMVNNIPVIIKLDLSDWDSFRNWFSDVDVTKLDVTYLKSKLGNIDVPIAKCSEQYFNSHAKIQMKLFDFLDNWDTEAEQDEGLYLKDWHLRNEMPHYEFYKVPEYFSSDFLNEFLVDTGQDDYKFVYIGKKGTYTPFHSDVFSSFSWSINLRGRKRWYMLPSGEEDKLRDALGNLPFSIDPKMLEEKNVKYFTIIQDSQEAIFVPCNWYHQVHNELDTVSINHNWFNACNLDKIWSALKTNEEKVIEEISDCRDMENFKEHCQVMLKAHFGMNYEGFLDLIEHVSKKRIDCIKEKRALSVEDGHHFHESHLIFDLKRISDVLMEISADSDVQALSLNQKCDNVLRAIEDIKINI